MLTSKERAKYAGLANKIDVDILIGKEGLNDNVLKQISQYLEAHELAKIKMQKSVDYTNRQLCDLLVEKLQAEPVLLVGNKVILYKKSSRTDIIHI
ncbi:MAG: YhbY family RNA-binding protein [Clostridia bacterium]|nr:YhbY family RNA-binding protein [Clostridia bacterium]